MGPGKRGGSVRVCAVAERGRVRLQVWDNNHNRDFHTLVEKDVDREAFEEETYKRLLAESLDHDTESANRAGAHNSPLPSPTHTPQPRSCNPQLSPV